MGNNINKSRCVRCNRVFYCLYNYIVGCDEYCKLYDSACYCPECYPSDGDSVEGIPVKKFRAYTYLEAIILAI